MSELFGMHGSLTAEPGQGDALAALLLEAADVLGDDDGCLLYVVSRSPEVEEVIWVTEVWTDREAHAASLEDERVRAIIRQATPLIAGRPESSELRPLGGKGLPLAPG
jgi:quinol monooxygenase YgiN